MANPKFSRVTSSLDEKTNQTASMTIFVTFIAVLFRSFIKFFKPK